MKTVHLFDDIVGIAGSERQQRVYRSSKVLYSLATKSGGKINPATVWMDAALSCVDAINAYLRLQRAREVTRQLEMVKNSLEIQLEDQRKIIEMHQNDIREDQEKSLECLELYFQKERKAADIFLKKISKSREEIFQMCRFISELRHSGSYSKELRLLIKVTDELVFATLNAINSQMGSFHESA
jgi:hypothetical protein